MGTGDELGLDILINSIKGLSREYVGVKQLIIGGQNEDWPIPEEHAPQVRHTALAKSSTTCTVSTANRCAVQARTRS